MNDPALDYLYSLQRFGMKLGVECMQQMMELLGNPHHTFKSLHVAGTNGKGSVCAFLAETLKRSGHKTGLYTSPHLVRFNERIKINGVDVTDEELKKLTLLIKEKIEHHSIEPTFFEFTTALAFLYFAQQGVDTAVIEVGMGGRLDATNVLTPLISIITHIDFDHQEHLGDTKLKIAAEKAGIIKHGVPLVTAETDPEVLALLEKTCNEKHAQFIRLGKELLYTKIAESTFSTSGPVHDAFKVSLLGDHQLTNAATALLTLLTLQKNSFYTFPSKTIKDALNHTFWPGRLQTLGDKPTIILDGAHNPEGMRALKDYLRTLPQKKIFVIGIKEDKSAQEMLSLIGPLAQTIIVTESSFHPTDCEKLATQAKPYCSHVKVAKTPHEALTLAKQLAKPEDLIICTGSLYLLGDILTILEPQSN